MLTKDFSFFAFHSAAAVFISGEDAPEKAMELSVLYMGGRKLVAKLLTSPGKSTAHRRPLGIGGRGGMRQVCT